MAISKSFNSTTLALNIISVLSVAGGSLEQVQNIEALITVSLCSPILNSVPFSQQSSRLLQQKFLAYYLLSLAETVEYG